MQKNITQVQLKNGMKVMLKEIRTAPIISSWIWYKVGSRDESTGKTGISHWTEHMMFKGTKKFPGGLLDKAISREGGAWNALGASLFRPGAWMDTLRRFMAFPMLATVVWLVWVLGHLSGVDGAGALLAQCLDGNPGLREAVALTGGWHGQRHAVLRKLTLQGIGRLRKIERFWKA